MSRPKRFAKGEPVPSLAAAVAEMEAGRWLMMHGVPKHPRVLFNMSLATLQAFIRGRSLCYAIDLQATAGSGP